MSYIITIDLDQYDHLPPRQLKAMLRALRFTDSEGVVHASLSMLAMPGLSRSTAHRELAGLEDAGHVDRQQRPEGGFLWRIGKGFRYRPQSKDGLRPPGFIHRPSSWDDAPKTIRTAADSFSALSRKDSTTCAIFPPNGKPVPPAETPVPQRGTTDSRATPAVKNLSSGSKEPSERELSLKQDEIPNGWEEAAGAERRFAGLGPVNLRAEWRKLVAHVEGAPITIWRWRGWALKARSAPTVGGSGSESIVAANTSLPGDDREQRQARDWVRRGFWLRDGSWGPAPDQAGCTLPAELVAWCLRERQTKAAA